MSTRDESLRRILAALAELERADASLPAAGGANGSGAARSAAIRSADAAKLAPFWPRLAELDAKVRQRRAVGPGLTVVAVLGATGAGKSSLLNALAGAEVAPVSVLRPTTSRPLAVVSPASAAEARPLLGSLGIEAVRQAAITPGLVLIDLPDLDSTSTAHRDEALRVAELADVLLWVLDPQKYADAAVHTEAIARYAGHEAVTHVVLNKTDTLEAHDAAAVAAHLGELLPAGWSVLPTSATGGRGLARLREELEARARAKDSALARLLADARELGGQVLAACPAKSPTPDWGRLTDALVESCGAASAAEQGQRAYAREAGRHYNVFARLGGKVLPTEATLVPARPLLSGVTEELEALEAGLVHPSGVTERAERLSHSAEEVLRGATVAPAKRTWWALTGALSWVGGILLAVSLLWLAGLAGALALGWPLVKAPLHLLGLGGPLASGTWLGELPAPTLLLAVSVVLLAVTGAVGALAGRTGARRHGKAVQERVRADLANLVDKQVARRLAPHLERRQALARARADLAAAL
ncbi:dynamin family protein [Buchananella felis]|uniref:dynamin family protein n=1 Tax=Buchananella felis TaxID=3231492 RepID=UPI003528DF9E